MDFGDQMRTLRAARALSQAGLSHTSGIPDYMISLLEGGRAMPTPAQETAIREALGWTKSVDKGLALIAGQED